MNWAGDAGIWSSWLNTAAYDGIVAVPVALLMIGGEFDLSAGVMIGSSGLLLGILTTQADWNIWPAIAVVLLFGIAIGCLNGFTVTRTRLPSFIVTLGTFFMLRGLNAGATIKITGGVSINNIDAASGFAFAHKLFASIVWPQYGLSVAVLWWLGLTAAGAWLLSRTRFGNWIFGSGGDPVAARNVGVPVARTKIVLFVMTSTVAACVGDHDRREPARHAEQRGRGPRVRVHHRRGGRRVPADRRLRLGDRDRVRRGDHRHGPDRDHLVRLGLELGLLLRGRRAPGGRDAEHGDPAARGASQMSVAESTGHLVELEHVGKYFGNVVALKDVSLYVNAGEVTCVLGDNGAGKSTLIKIISGLHQHDGGTVRVDGSEVQLRLPAGGARPTASPPSTRTWRWCR